MSKSRWYGEKLRKTTVSLPLSVYMAAKRNNLSFSRLLRIAILRTLQKGDELTKFYQEITEKNQKLREKVKSLTLYFQENRLRITQLEEENKRLRK